MKKLSILALLALPIVGCTAEPQVVTVTATATKIVTTTPSPTETITAEDVEPEVEIRTLPIPDLLGENASDALDEIRDFGFVDAQVQDATDEERIVLLRSNWYVCTMRPGPGELLETDKVVVLLSVKNSELCPGTESSSKPTQKTTAPSATSTPSPTATQTQQQLTTGQRNAVRKAESYLSFMSFSRTGLIDQLEFEGFSTSDSTFAVDYLDINWNRQAAEKAASYLEFMAFSRQGLIDQLLFEGFTQSQAEYGVSQNGY